jgi:glycosyltransferase involved in cell wall biosynthesis
VPRNDVVAVVPALDCERTIGLVVSELRRHLERVVVVDDGSRDATGERALAAGAHVTAHARNLGKGAALRTGLRAALEPEAAAPPDAIALLDADGQHDPADLPAFLDAWDSRRPDLVVGARLADRAAIPPARFWTNYIGSRILSRMTGYELEDSQSGYRLLAAGLARRLELVSTGYAVESEMLIKAARLGARLEHVRIRTIYNDSGSHFRPLLDTYRISRASIRFKVFDDPG